MRVKWNRNLDGSQSQQKEEENESLPPGAKVAVCDAPASGGFLKIFRLKRHRKAKHSESLDNRQPSVNDSFESYRPTDDDTNRSDLAVQPLDDDAASSICEESKQCASNGLLFQRSVSVSQSRRGSEDYSDLKYRSLPSVGKGWFSFASRKSWLNLSSRGHNRSSKDDKKVSASSQSIPSRSLRNNEKLIEENLLRNTPERRSKSCSENPFPPDRGLRDVISETKGTQQEGSPTNNGYTKLHTCEGGALEKNSALVVCVNKTEQIDPKNENVKKKLSLVGEVECIVHENKNEFNVKKQNHCEDSVCKTSANVVKTNSPNSKTRDVFTPPVTETEKYRNPDDEPCKSKGRGAAIVRNHLPEIRCEQSVTNDTLFHSVPSYDAVSFSSAVQKQDRTFVCQTEQQQQVTVERTGEDNNSLPWGDNGEKNQQRNGIPTALSTTTTGFGNSASQMKSLGSGSNTIIARVDRLVPWNTEVTHRNIPKDGRDAACSADEIADPVMYFGPEFSKLTANDTSTKWYVPIYDIHQGIDDASKKTATSEILVTTIGASQLADQVGSYVPRQKNHEASSGSETGAKHVFGRHHSNSFVSSITNGISIAMAGGENVPDRNNCTGMPSELPESFRGSQAEVQEKRLSVDCFLKSEADFVNISQIDLRECSEMCVDPPKSDETVFSDNLPKNSSKDVHDMNQRNVNLSICVKGTSSKSGAMNKCLSSVPSSKTACESRNHIKSCLKAKSTVHDSISEQNFTAVVSGHQNDVDVACTDKCPASVAANMLNRGTPNFQTACSDCRQMNEIPLSCSKNAAELRDYPDTAVPNMSFENSPNSVSNEKHSSKDLSDTNENVNSLYTDHVVNLVEDKPLCEDSVAGSFQGTFSDQETELNFGVFPFSQPQPQKRKDVIEDVLQKSVSSDSGISEEIPESITEEVRCENLFQRGVTKFARQKGENVLERNNAVTLYHAQHLPKETERGNSISGHYFAEFLQQKIDGKRGTNNAENTGHNNAEKISGSEDYSEEYSVSNGSSDIDTDTNEISNYVKDEQNNCEIDSSAGNYCRRNSSSNKQSYCRRNSSSNKQIEIIAEHPNSTQFSDDDDVNKNSMEEACALSVISQSENCHINSSDFLDISSYKLPLVSSESSLREGLFPSCSGKISRPRENFRLGAHDDAFSVTFEKTLHKAVKIYNLCSNDSGTNRTNGCTLCGHKAPRLVDIFSNDDYSSVNIFYVDTPSFHSEYSWCTYKSLYSRYATLPFANCDLSSPFKSLMWNNTGSHPHVYSGETMAVSNSGKQASQCIPVTCGTKYASGQRDLNTVSSEVRQRNFKSSFIPVPGSLFKPGLAPLPEVEDDLPKSVDKDTQWESTSDCGSETASGICAVDSKARNSDVCLSIVTGQNVVSASGSKPQPDKTETSTKDRIILRKSRIPRKHGSVRVLHHPSPKPVRPPMWLSRAELSQEIQHLGTLCEARTKELNLLKMKLKHATLGFDAFVAVFKYLTEDLDALSHPQLVKELAKTQKLLHQAKNDIVCYEKQIEELKTHHAKELAELSGKMLAVYQSELQQVTSKQGEELQLIEEQHQKKMVNLQASFMEASEKAKTHHEKEAEAIRQKFLKQKEEAELLHQSEMKHLEESHLEVQKSLQAEIEQLKLQYAESKQQSRNIEETLQKDTDTKLQWISCKKADLEKEVDSLKAVLEMKNNEIHSLRKENLEMQKELEELPIAKEKIKMLQARAEDLQALMAEKVRVERQLSTEHQTMKEVFERESKMNKRLSMENEELQWRLKQTSELSLLLRSQTNSPDVLETPSPPKSPWQQQQSSRSKFFTYMDASECDPESPQAKSPVPVTSSRSKFFTFVDPSEYDAQSPHSPRYKRIAPSLSSSPCKQPPVKNPVKLPLASTPRKNKGISEAPPGGATPRKMSKKQNGKDSQVYANVKSSDEEAADAANIPTSMDSSISSEDSALQPRDLEDPIAPICNPTKELLSDENAECTRLEYGKSVKQDSDVCVLGEVTDPKKYYHMTFPVLKETGPDCDVDEGNNYLLIENNETCFLTAKETSDPSENVLLNGYVNPNGETHFEPENTQNETKRLTCDKMDCDSIEQTSGNSNAMDTSSYPVAVSISHTARNEDSKGNNVETSSELAST